jgi:hypothetical protein
MIAVKAAPANRVPRETVGWDARPALGCRQAAAPAAGVSVASDRPALRAASATNT